MSSFSWAGAHKKVLTDEHFAHVQNGETAMTAVFQSLLFLIFSSIFFFWFLVSCALKKPGQVSLSLSFFDCGESFVLFSVSIYRGFSIFFLLGGDFVHAHVDISIRSSCYLFSVLIAFKEEFYELIEDGPKPAENEETAAEIEAGKIEEKQK